MVRKLNVGILFGGRSCEHEVSVTSARSVMAAIDKNKYNISLIGIDKTGHWHLHEDIEQLIEGKIVRELGGPEGEPNSTELVSLALHHEGNLAATSHQVPGLPRLDVVFPVLHGTFGEDGTIQGVFELAGIPYVGCGVAASAIAMDKALAKQIFEAAGIPQAPCRILHRWQWDPDADRVLNELIDSVDFPQFVKPANMGSSVGVSKAGDRTELEAAIIEAFAYDNKIVVERSMENCHEVECAVLGNHEVAASVVGEILPGATFYDYQTKYIDDKTETLIPARISDESADKVRQLAIRAFQAIDGSGLSRVDFFVSRDTGEVFLNEINTLPGFTPISMYPQMWAASGIDYPDLIDRLIELALERHASRAALKRAF